MRNRSRPALPCSPCTGRAALLVLALCAGPAFGAELNLADQVAEGGVALLATVGLSVLALAVALERLVHLRQQAVVPPALLARAQLLWEAQRFTELQALAAEDRSALARVVAWLAAHRHQPYAVVSSAAGDIASQALRQHQHKAYALAIVATVAPIVGLLGTVLGMIDAFQVIAFADGMSNPALLASGISKALINTAAGLAVALPALGLHHFFKYRLTALGLTLEMQVSGLIDRWFLPPPAPTGQREAAHAD